VGWQLGQLGKVRRDISSVSAEYLDRVALNESSCAHAVPYQLEQAIRGFEGVTGQPEHRLDSGWKNDAGHGTDINSRPACLQDDGRTLLIGETNRKEAAMNAGTDTMGEQW
jgi:hypothetical protein